MPGTMPKKRSTQRSAARRPAKQRRASGARGTGLMPLTITRDELLVAGVDREFRRFIYDLNSLAVRMDRLRSRIGMLDGLNSSQYHILMVIAELSGAQSLNVNAVADALRTSGAFITREVGVLVRRKLVRKLVKRDDRRHLILELTPSGQRVLDGMAPALRRINDTLFEGVSAADFAGMRRLMAAMLENMPAALDVAERIVCERGQGCGPAA